MKKRLIQHYQARVTTDSIDPHYQARVTTGSIDPHCHARVATGNIDPHYNHMNKKRTRKTSSLYCYSRRGEHRALATVDEVSAVRLLQSTR